MKKICQPHEPRDFTREAFDAGIRGIRRAMALRMAASSLLLFPQIAIKLHIQVARIQLSSDVEHGVGPLSAEHHQRRRDGGIEPERHLRSGHAIDFDQARQYAWVQMRIPDVRNTWSGACPS